MRKYRPNTIYRHLDLSSTQIIRTHTNITPPLQTLVQAPYPLTAYATHTTATQVQTQVQHPLFPQDWKSPNPFLSSTTPRSTHAAPSQTHTPPTPLIPRTTLIHSTSTALDTIPEPREQPTCPALTTTPLIHPTNQHCRHPRTLTLYQHTHMQHKQRYTHHSHINHCIHITDRPTKTT